MKWSTLCKPSCKGMHQIFRIVCACFCLPGKNVVCLSGLSILVTVLYSLWSNIFAIIGSVILLQSLCGVSLPVLFFSVAFGHGPHPHHLSAQSLFLHCFLVHVLVCCPAILNFALKMAWESTHWALSAENCPCFCLPIPTVSQQNLALLDWAVNVYRGDIVTLE